MLVFSPEPSATAGAYREDCRTLVQWAVHDAVCAGKPPLPRTLHTPYVEPSRERKTQKTPAAPFHTLDTSCCDVQSPDIEGIDVPICVRWVSACCLSIDYLHHGKWKHLHRKSIQLLIHERLLYPIETSSRHAPTFSGHHGELLNPRIASVERSLPS